MPYLASLVLISGIDLEPLGYFIVVVFKSVRDVTEE